MGRDGGEVTSDRPSGQNRRRSGARGPPRPRLRRLIALDASVAVEILAGSKTGRTAAALIADERLAVPAHFDAEVYSAFRRHFRQGLITRRQLDTVTRHLVALAAERVALPPLLVEAHVLADRLSVGDAFYIALARARRIELWTADARLDRAAVGLADVRLIA